MTTHPAEPRFPGDCRRFLARLDELIASGGSDPHAEQCRRCAAALAGSVRVASILRGGLEPVAAPEAATAPEFLEGIYARANAKLERQASDVGFELAPTEAPPAASHPDFLAAIYERASHALEEDLGSEVRAGLRPAQAPRDAVWVEDDRAAELAPILQRIFTRSRSPGWMWKRVRGTVNAPVTEPRRAWRASVGLIAAAFLVSAALFFHSPFSDVGNQGTNPLNHVVFEERLEPFESSLSMAAFREIGR